MDDQKIVVQLTSDKTLVFDATDETDESMSISTLADNAESIGLGPIDQGQSLVVKDISADGRVVMGDYVIDGNQRSFRWSRETGIVELPMPAGYRHSYAIAISENGGTITAQFVKADSTARIGTWTAGDAAPTLRPLSGNWRSTHASVAVGSLVGGYAFRGDSRSRPRISI